MKRAIVAGILMVAVFLSRAQRPNNESAAPPEIKKTVDALVGLWLLTGTNTESGAKTPVNFEMKMDCKRAALGAAVTCSFSGKMPGVGPLEASAVIGYDPEEKVVRWMEISSTGEYHDHRGRWKNNAIEFEPLEYSVSGKKATEDLRIAFPASGKLTLTSTTQTAEGKSVLECTGNRVGSKSR